MSRREAKRYGLFKFRKTTPSFDDWVTATLKPETVTAMKAGPSQCFRLTLTVFDQRRRGV